VMLPAILISIYLYFSYRKIRKLIVSR
jgi:hypothetical protein